MINIIIYIQIIININKRAKKIIHNMFGEDKGKILISLADFIKNRNK